MDMNNPNCPHCGRRLVFVAIAVRGGIYKTWQCDCPYQDGRDVPGEIVTNIRSVRDLPDGSIAVNEIRQVGEYSTVWKAQDFWMA